MSSGVTRRAFWIRQIYDLWPHPGHQPTVSTLNAADGAITSNMAIVPNGDGKTGAHAQGTTHLILDISGYFAP
jgi:hypothetical protein